MTVSASARSHGCSSVVKLRSSTMTNRCLCPPAESGMLTKSRYKYSNGRVARTMYQSGLGTVPPQRNLMQARQLLHLAMTWARTFVSDHPSIAKDVSRVFAVSVLERWKWSP